MPTITSLLSHRKVCHGRGTYQPSHVRGPVRSQRDSLGQYRMPGVAMPMQHGVLAASASAQLQNQSCFSLPSDLVAAGLELASNERREAI